MKCGERKREGDAAYRERGRAGQGAEGQGSHRVFTIKSQSLKAEHVAGLEANNRSHELPHMHTHTHTQWAHWTHQLNLKLPKEHGHTYTHTHTYTHMWLHI